MKTTTTPDTLDHLLAITYGCARVVIRDLLIPLLALLVTLATLHREPTLPRLQKAEAAPAAPLALPPAPLALPQATAQPVQALELPQALHSLNVAELRQLARAAGHKTLARSGRRQQLLEVLA